MSRNERLDKKIQRHTCGGWVFADQPCLTCFDTDPNEATA